MAETLGSLVDKLSIKNIRLMFLEQDVYKTEDREKKIQIVQKQCADLRLEIDSFLQAAKAGEVRLTDLKLKLYTNPISSHLGVGLGELIHNLCSKNLELWQLEDQARRTDLPDAKIVATKRSIDKTNQERNDLIDSIDIFLEKQITRNHNTIFTNGAAAKAAND